MLKPRVHHFEVVDSTNEVALELARRGQPEGTVVTANRQLAGRGRLGRTWWDEPGKSAMLSIILSPSQPAERLSELAFAAGVGVAEYLATCGLDVGLKWPNDVLVSGRKLAGILVELAVAGEAKRVVVGVGMNVNQTSFPPEVAASATSAAVETGTQWCVDDVRLGLVQSIISVYDDYQRLGFEEILTRWRKYMFGVGSRADVTTEGTVVHGVILDVDSDGALLVEDEAGKRLAIHAADGVRIPA